MRILISKLKLERYNLSNLKITRIDKQKTKKLILILLKLKD